MSELLLVVLSLVLLLQPNQPPQQEPPLPLPLRRMMSEMMLMTPDVAHDDAADDENAGVGGVEPPIPKGGTAGVVDNSVAPLASSFTDDLLIRRAELLRDDRRQQHSE